MAETDKDLQLPLEVNEKVEEQEDNSLEDLQAQLAEERKFRAEAEAKSKDLASRLTKEQQEKAELYKFHRATLPRLNQAVEKSFAEAWEDSPERAVEHKVETKVVPMQSDVAALRAQVALNTVITKHPDWTKYEDRAVQLGDEFPQLTYTQQGIEKLFSMARSEDLEEEIKRLKSNGQAEAEKTRAFTESSTSREPKKSKKAASPWEKQVAEQLGIPVDDYVKHKEIIDAEAKESLPE
jgi:hypothetical protein